MRDSATCGETVNIAATATLFTKPKNFLFGPQWKLDIKSSLKPCRQSEAQAVEDESAGVLIGNLEPFKWTVK